MIGYYIRLNDDIFTGVIGVSPGSLSDKVSFVETFNRVLDFRTRYLCVRDPFVVVRTKVLT